MANKRDDDSDDDLGYGPASGAGSGTGSASGAGRDRDSSGTGPGVGDTLKKLFTAGISAAFMTEESVRSFVSELKLPKETINLVLQGAQKSKDQLMDRVGREVVSIISRIDFVKEASRFVEEHKFRITAEIEVTKRDGREGREGREGRDGARSSDSASSEKSAGEESGGGFEFSIKPKSKS